MHLRILDLCGVVSSRFVGLGWFLFICSTVSFLSEACVPRERVGATGVVLAPSSQAVAAGSNATFTCYGAGAIKWELNGQQIYQEVGEQARPGQGIKYYAEINRCNMSTIVLTPHNASYNGSRIRCLVLAQESDLHGVRSNESYLYVFENPYPPLNLEIAQLGLSLHLSWEAPFSVEGENITYFVTVTNTHSRESREIETSSPELVFSESIGERDCSLYEFHVYSVNPFGRSNTGISATERIPTEPLMFSSSSVVSSTVDFTDGMLITLEFRAPFPCSSYPISAYNVTFHDQISNYTHSPLHFENDHDRVMIKINAESYSGIMRDRIYVVSMEAINDAGSTTSGVVEIYTTGLQSSSVVLELNDTASVTCNFARGSDALGCEVSFYASSMEQLLFAQNITREPGSNITTENIPLMGWLQMNDNTNIAVQTAEWQADGVVSSISIEADIEIIPDGNGETTVSLSSDGSMIYIIVGVVLGVLVAILLIAIFLVFICLRRVRRKPDATVQSHAYDLPNGSNCTHKHQKAAECDPGPLYDEIPVKTHKLHVDQQYEEVRCGHSHKTVAAGTSKMARVTNTQFSATNPIYRSNTTSSTQSDAVSAFNPMYSTGVGVCHQPQPQQEDPYIVMMESSVKSEIAPRYTTVTY